MPVWSAYFPSAQSEASCEECGAMSNNEDNVTLRCDRLTSVCLHHFHRASSPPTQPRMPLLTPLHVSPNLPGLLNPYGSYNISGSRSMGSMPVIKCLVSRRHAHSYWLDDQGSSIKCSLVLPGSVLWANEPPAPPHGLSLINFHSAKNDNTREEKKQHSKMFCVLKKVCHNRSNHSIG